MEQQQKRFIALEIWRRSRGKSVGLYKGETMRVTEYIHFITRMDIGMAQREKANDYTHFTPWTKQKRERYLYQCFIRGKTPVK